MSGTSLDAVDAALILTDGEQVLDFGGTAERKYTNEERLTLQRATDAARAWNWNGVKPGEAFEAACQVITSTHRAAWDQLLSAWSGPKPELAGVHGQTLLHRAPMAGVNGATLQLIDAPAMQSALGVPLAFDFRSDDVAAGGGGGPFGPPPPRPPRCCPCA
ncbi:MAG TPA: anhydro-N-acetylmuramic acid kinase, partial [Hyphomonas atlantica]|nr:anhydro-N-acetylmuramic acid kinase [Hyphomonas atlantica]